MRSLLRIPRTRGTQTYVVLLACVLVGLAMVAAGFWRKGLVVIGAVFVVAAGARAALPGEQSGLLAVRGRGFDVAWTAFLGVSLVVLAFSVPPGPTV